MRAFDMTGHEVIVTPKPETWKLTKKCTSKIPCQNPDCGNKDSRKLSRVRPSVYECEVCGGWFDTDLKMIIWNPKQPK